MNRLSLTIAVVGAASVLAACGSSGSSAKNTPAAGSTTAPASSAASSALPTAPGAITIGSADFPENEILADVYGDAMAAKGVTVTKKLNIGERPAYMLALNHGAIDFIPEYTGSILVYLDPKATAKTPAEVYTALQAAAAPKLTALTYSSAQDSDTITVTKQTATQYHLTSIADLAPVAGQLSFGAPAGFKTRADGIPALKSVYGVTFKRFVPLAAGGSITVTALKNGTINGADIFSTDPSIAANGFVSLTDPKSMFAAQNIVPLVTTAKLSQPIVDASNAVSAKLDTAALAGLVTKVVVDKQDPDAVAKAWLTSAGLI